MSTSAFIKMRDEFAIALILAAFLTFLLAFIPNYQKHAYKDTEPVEYSSFMRTDCVGYPSAESIPTVNSIAEIEEAKETYFTIELDRANLTPIDLYLYLEERTFSTNGFMRIINNNDFGGVGRFFVAELESGEEVVVLLDDTTIDLPKKGEIRLPIGKSVKVNSDKIKGMLRDKSGLPNVESYVDMAGDWRESEEAKEVEKFRYLIMTVVFIGSWIMFSVLMVRVTKEEKKK